MRVLQAKILLSICAVLLVLGPVGLAVNPDAPPALEPAASDDLSNPSPSETQATDGTSPADEPPGPIASPGAPGQASPPPTESVVRPGSRPRDPGPTSPARPGTYRYRQTTRDTGSNGQERTNTEETALRYETTGESGGEVLQTVRFEEDGIPIEAEVGWRRDALVVKKLRLGAGEGQSGECDFEPDLVDLKLQLARGSEWTNDSTCEMQFGADRLKLRHSEKARVSDLVQLLVGGTAVDCWLIERNISQTYTSVQGEVTQQRTVKEHFSPKHGLSIKVSSVSTSAAPDGRTSTRNRDQEILSLTPA